MPEIVATCTLWIAGAPIPDGSAGDPNAPVAMDGLSIKWGRQTSIDQPNPSTCSVDILDRGSGPVRVDALVALGATLVVEATVTGQPTVIVFFGRITDLDIQWDDAGGGVCAVIAVDLMGDLANRFVGAEPWPQETLQARANRIMTSIGASATVTVDPRPAALPVSRMDVDRQAAAGLLRDLATSGTSALWVVVPSGTAVPALRIEDPSSRSSMRVLAQDVPTLLWKIRDAAAGGGDVLDACSVVRDPVHWSRAVTDLLTRVTVRWLDPSTSPNPTERSVIVVDTESEVTYGARGLSVGTILASQTAADQAASVIIAGHRPSPAWRADGITWDLSATAVTTATVALAVALLDNSHRIGLALTIDGLPWWAPAGAQAGMYVEGGTYKYRDGRWVLALAGIPATGVGGSLSYGATDASIRYVDIDPTITFLDMIGVGPRQNTGPAWADIAAGRPWSSAPAGTDWSEFK